MAKKYCIINFPYDINSSDVSIFLALRVFVIYNFGKLRTFNL